MVTYLLIVTIISYRHCNFTNLHYQFFEHGTNIPIAVKFHLGFTDLDFNEALKIDEKVVSKVFVDNNSNLPYQINDGMLAITRDYNNANSVDDPKTGQYTHAVLFEIDSPESGFNFSVATSGHDEDATKITQGSKVAPSILSTMLYPGTVTTHYVDESGNVIADNTVTKDTVGQNYNTTKPSEITKDGVTYVLVPAKNPSNAIGQYVDGNVDVTYVYSKKEAPTPALKTESKENNVEQKQSSDLKTSTSRYIITHSFSF